jgi:hypothetical protein
MKRVYSVAARTCSGSLICSGLLTTGLILGGLFWTPAAEAQAVKDLDSMTGSSGASADGPGLEYPGMPESQKAARQTQGTGSQRGGGSGNTDESRNPYEAHSLEFHVVDDSFYMEPTRLDISRDKLYRGIIPGLRSQVEEFKSAKKTSTADEANRLTWLGFDTESETPRVFVQTERDVSYELKRQKGEKSSKLVLTLPNTEPATRRFRWPLELEGFKTHIRRANLRRTKDGTGLELVVEYATNATPKVESEDGFIYVSMASAKSDGQQATRDPSENSSDKTEGEDKQRDLKESAEGAEQKRETGSQSESESIDVF